MKLVTLPYGITFFQFYIEDTVTLFTKKSLFVRGDADNSLARPTSRCRRTGSIVSLERRVYSCAELQVFSCYRDWKEECQATRAISTKWRRELSSGIFFPAMQGAEGNLRHSVRNLRGTGTIVCHRQKLGGPVWTWWFFHLWCASSWTTQNSDYPGIVQINELILEYRRISAKSIAEQLGISRERAGSIIHEDLAMRKLSAKWVPKCLNADQKRQRCQSSEQLLEFFRRDPNDFLSRLVTMDKTWLYHYDPETKQQSMEWRYSGSPRPQKFRVQKSTGKVLASSFSDQDGIILIDYLPKGQTINAEYCPSLLV